MFLERSALLLSIVVILITKNHVIMVFDSLIDIIHNNFLKKESRRGVLLKGHSLMILTF